MTKSAPVILCLLVGVLLLIIGCELGQTKPDVSADGCLFRVVKVRQTKLEGGNWGPPKLLYPDDYKDGYQFVKCESWTDKTRISTKLKKALQKQQYPVGNIIDLGCGRGLPDMDATADIFIRTAKDAGWEYGKDTENVMYPDFREMSVGCFARSTKGEKCRCADQPEE